MHKKNKGRLGKVQKQLAEARLAAAIRKAVRELDKLYKRTLIEQVRIEAVLGELGAALHERYDRKLPKTCDVIQSWQLTQSAKN